MNVLILQILRFSKIEMVLGIQFDYQIYISKRSNLKIHRTYLYNQKKKKKQ